MECWGDHQPRSIIRSFQPSITPIPHHSITPFPPMIIDLQRFLTAERPYWAALERLLDRIETEPNLRMNLEQVQHFHSLFERTAADLARITTFSSEPETRRYLENLVARGYGEIHETRE